MNLTELNKVRNHPLHKALGIHTIDAANGHSTIELIISEKILNPSGTFHGGVLYLISDVVAFCALMSVMEEGKIGVTNNINIQVMRHCNLGDSILFEGKVVKMGKRLAFLETTVKKEDKLIAKASITKTLIG